MKRRSDLKPINCTSDEIEYLIINTFSKEPLGYGFRYSNQATTYIKENLIDIDDQKYKNPDDDDDYEVVHISEILKEKNNIGQNMLIILIVLFALYVISHIM